jgi:hypothetical protein
VGFEPTISVLERAKTVHALDRAATAIGDNGGYVENNLLKLVSIATGYELYD